MTEHIESEPSDSNKKRYESRELILAIVLLVLLIVSRL